MKPLFFTLVLVFIAFNSPRAGGGEDSHRPGRAAALEEFDDSVNGATMLVDDIPPVDREVIMKEHREDEDRAMEDEMCGIDDALWCEHAGKKGWLDED